MNTEITSAADMLADGADSAAFGELEVRKGTIAAWVANVKKFEAMRPDAPGYAELAAHLREEAVKVKAVGVFDILTPRSPQVAEIIAGL